MQLDELLATPGLTDFATSPGSPTRFDEKRVGPGVSICSAPDAAKCFSMGAQRNEGNLPEVRLRSPEVDEVLDSAKDTSHAAQGVCPNYRRAMIQMAWTSPGT